MCVCVCVCARARARAVMRAGVWKWGVCCFGGADVCIPLIMLVDVCQCCCLLMFVYLPLLDTFLVVKLGE